MKLIVQEAESDALRLEIQAWSELASSLVSRVEVPRAVRRRTADAVLPDRHTESILEGLAYLDIDLALTAEATRLDPPELRSLDAIHLASALSLGADLGAIATYDARLADAARSLAITVVSPT